MDINTLEDDLKNDINNLRKDLKEFYGSQHFLGENYESLKEKINDHIKDNKKLS